VHYRIEYVRRIHPIGDNDEFKDENQSDYSDAHGLVEELVSKEFLRSESNFEHELEIKSVGGVMRPSYVVVGHLQIKKLQRVYDNQEEFND